MQNTEKGGKSGGVFFVLLLIAAAIYLIFATRAGDYLSEKVIAPIVRYFAEKEDTQDVFSETSAEVESAEISFPAMEEYLLQYGVFTSRENAENAAQTLREIGGAGYLYTDDGKYRVIISGYALKSDAENVKERLKNERDMDTKLLELSAEEIRFTVNGSAAEITQMTDYASVFSQVHTRLGEAALSLDRGELSETDAVALISELEKQNADALKTLSDLSIGNDDDLLEKLVKYCSAQDSLLSATDASATGAALSAEMKHAYIGSAYAYYALLSDAE